MEKVNEAIKDQEKKDLNFFSFVFNFDEDNKAGILNMLQYTTLAIIPVITILKLVKYYIPEDDESKGNIEILAEIIIQLLIIFLAIWFIDKMIRYVPTYSGFNYYKFNETNFIIPTILILITMQTKLGAKINIVIERITELWFGSAPPPVKKSSQQVNIIPPSVPVHQPSQADILNNNFIPPPPGQNLNNQTTSITDLPQMNTQQYNDIQNQLVDPNPLMAANEALGGAFGGSSF